MLRRVVVIDQPEDGLTDHVEHVRRIALLGTKGIQHVRAIFEAIGEQARVERRMVGPRFGGRGILGNARGDRA